MIYAYSVFSVGILMRSV